LLLLTVESIEKYKSACASLRSSEARLDLAMEASELSMWEWNIPEDAVYYNDQWRHSVGIDADELLQRTDLVGRLMLPTDAPEVVQQLERHLHGVASHFEAEYELPTRFGSPKWFAARAKVVRRDAAGAPLRVIGVLRDVSRRRQMQREAHDVEQRWERAVRGTSDGLYDWDLLTGHVWYTARFREMVGYDEREFPDTFGAFQSLLHKEDGAAVLAGIRAHLENRTALDVRCRLRVAAGDWMWCRLRGRAQRDPAGRPLRLAGSISDISAQIRAEEALSRSQDFYGTILDSLPLLIAYADCEQRVIYANRRFQEFFGTVLTDSHAQSVAEVVGDQHFSVIGPHVREALAGTVVETHGKFCDTSGRSLDMDATFLPHRDESGAMQGCFVAARDVTEKRQLEAELRQSQKMEAVGRLTGGIAHDFNNLLSVIVGNTQLLARAMRQSPRLLKQAETALKAAMRGAELTRRLLAFARQQVLEPRVVDLNTLIGGMFELLRRSLTGDIEIRQALDADVWPIKVDPGQLENAVLNLAINARDAMPEGGAISIVTRNVSIVAGERTLGEEPLRAGDYALIEISDTGSGMSPEVLKRVFEPFFTTKDVGKGSGLGLSMVYGFLKQSEGHVSIASAIGSGTTVYLYFPRTQAAVEKHSLIDNEASELRGGKETILVVEDNAEVRATAVEVLTSLGYRPLEATNGYQALDQFMQHPEIALVFSDVMLPGGLLGANLVTKLRERSPGLKVLLTTGYTESAIMHRGMLDGSLEVLSKPYKLEDLARRIRAILDDRKESRRVPA
jgi:PAS domain S-box-containing protein